MEGKLNGPVRETAPAVRESGWKSPDPGLCAAAWQGRFPRPRARRPPTTPGDPSVEFGDRATGIQAAHINQIRRAFHPHRLGGGAVDALHIDVQIRRRLFPKAVAAGVGIRRRWLNPIDPDRQGADGGRSFDNCFDISWPRLPHLLQHLLTTETADGLCAQQPAQTPAEPSAIADPCRCCSQCSTMIATSA